MPRRAPTPCAKPGCPRLSAERYCPEHAKSEAKRYDRDRGSAASRGYDRSWRRTREAVLADEPLCRACLAEGRTRAATVVDHIVPMRRGGAKHDRDNLQALCATCHSAKTIREDGGFGVAAG